MRPTAGFLGRRLIAWCTALFTLLAPALAAACPQCAGRADGGIARAISIGAFVMFPFAIAYVVIRIIRAGERDDPRPRPVRAPSPSPWSLRGSPDDPRPG